MARAGALVAETIAFLAERTEPGITTGELDQLADSFIREREGIPTCFGYRGYPTAICISPNEVVVHGIPGAYVVAEGDLVTLDVAVTLEGAIADSAYTVGVGRIDDEAQRLLDVGQEALAAGIAQATVGNRIGDVSHAIQEVVESAGFSVVPLARRSRCGSSLPRGPARPELWRARSRATALGGDDDRDRADDHGRRSGRRAR